jgi:hypothetical protein
MTGPAGGPADHWSKFLDNIPAHRRRLTAASEPEAAAPSSVGAQVQPSALVDVLDLEDDEYPIQIGARMRGDWFPFYIDRFLGSRLVSTTDRDAAFVSIVLLAEAMRQDPAGTLPDDDAELAHLAGFGRDIDGWLDVRSRGALRKWTPVLCRGAESGEIEQIRLGHPVIAQVALEALKRINGQADRSRIASERALASRMRRLMREAGAHAGLTGRADFVDALIADLRRRGVRWNASNVLEAMQRLDVGSGSEVTGMRRRE